MKTITRTLILACAFAALTVTSFGAAAQGNEHHRARHHAHKHKPAKHHGHKHRPAKRHSAHHGE